MVGCTLFIVLVQAPGTVRVTAGASDNPDFNAWLPDRDYTMVGDRPLNQVSRASSATLSPDWLWGNPRDLFCALLP